MQTKVTSGMRINRPAPHLYSLNYIPGDSDSTYHLYVVAPSLTEAIDLFYAAYEGSELVGIHTVSDDSVLVATTYNDPTIRDSEMSAHPYDDTDTDGVLSLLQ